MSGPDDELLPEGVPSFEDPRYDALRADLASAHVDAPMPADVISRLDDVLAELGGNPVARPAADPVVVPLRRRSRAGTRLLAAAAVVVIVGAGAVGVTQVVRDQDGAGTASSDAAGSTAAGDKDQSSDSAGQGVVPGESSPGALADLLETPGTAVTLTRAGFDEQVTALLADKATVLSRRLSSLRTEATKQAPDVPLETLSGSAASPQASVPGAKSGTNDLGSTAYNQVACATVIAGRPTTPALLDGERVVLVVVEQPDGRARVEAHDCTGTKLLTSAVVGD